MDSTTAPRLEAKLLYRRLDSLFGALDSELPPRRLMESFLEDAFQTLRGDLRLKAAILFGEVPGRFSDAAYKISAHARPLIFRDDWKNVLTDESVREQVEVITKGK